jgi:hypothetical protein
MMPHQVFSQLVVVGLLGLFVMVYDAWLSPCAASQPRPATPRKPRRQRANAPKALAGLTPKPPCALCEHETAPPHAPLPVRPDPMSPTNRRPRTVDPSRHVCPHAGGRSRGGLGLGHRRANGHPRGGPWRPCHGTACNGSLPEHHGTIFPGKQGAVARIVRGLACVAAG